MTHVRLAGGAKVSAASAALLVITEAAHPLSRVLWDVFLLLIAKEVQCELQPQQHKIQRR